MATSNGGTTWKEQTVRLNGVLRGVAAVDATHAWVVGVNADGGPLIEATEDGRTWNAQRPAGSFGLSAVAFSDRLHGWAVGKSPRTVLVTADGGASWRKQSLSGGASSASGIVDIAATDSHHAWAISRDSVFVTSDGGVRWTLAGTSSSALHGIAAAMPDSR